MAQFCCPVVLEAHSPGNSHSSTGVLGRSQMPKKSSAQQAERFLVFQNLYPSPVIPGDSGAKASVGKGPGLKPGPSQTTVTLATLEGLNFLGDHFCFF